MFKNVVYSNDACTENGLENNKNVWGIKLLLSISRTLTYIAHVSLDVTRVCNVTRVCKLKETMATTFFNL
jgi:hypothetical protein